MDQQHVDILLKLDKKTDLMIERLDEHIRQDRAEHARFEKRNDDQDVKIARNAKFINYFLGAIGLAGTGVGTWFGLDK